MYLSLNTGMCLFGLLWRKCFVFFFKFRKRDFHFYTEINVKVQNEEQIKF